jgi:hypothetical protein
LVPDALGAIRAGFKESSHKRRSKDVNMAATAEDSLVFENEEWLVTESGLEHKHTGYSIDRERLGDRRSDGLWLWPLHMAEKQWCALAPFTEAFTCAAALYEIKVDTDLAQSFKAARCEIVGWPRGAPNPLFGSVGDAASALQKPTRIPISDGVLEPAPWDSGSSDEFGTVHRSGSAERERLSAPSTRKRARAGSMRGGPTLPWRTPRPIRKASTRLVRLLQFALYRK